MKILVSGGGTGGHITPILAVAHELKKQQPDCHIVYVGERHGKFSSLTDNEQTLDRIVTIFAGKFRRYHGESLLRRLTDFPTIIKNIRDVLYVCIGTIQAFNILSKERPDVVFLKGGYVGLPVGLAAAMHKIPFVTHDSDALPGLTNRLVGRWAHLHATGLPTEFYSYAKEKARYVGVLVGEDFTPVNDQLQQEYRKVLQLPVDGRLLLVTGGSLGARRLNDEVKEVVPGLLEKYPDLFIVHQVGKGNIALYKDIALPPRLLPLEFMEGMYRYTGAADVVITRAGANTLAELGVQGKACVVVPNPMLTGGHQLENAEYLLQHNAVLAVDEESFQKGSNDLRKAVEKLLDYPEIRANLGKALQTITKANAAQELASLLLRIGKQDVGS